MIIFLYKIPFFLDLYIRALLLGPIVALEKTTRTPSIYLVQNVLFSWIRNIFM